MLSYASLDGQVRRSMLEEIEMDIQAGSFYLSPRLSSRGVQEYPDLLKDAAINHDDAWLEDELRQFGRINATEQRRKPKGGYTVARVPITAAETMAEGEFNRFYIRGLCRDVLAAGGKEVKIYRAKSVLNPRPDSERKIGTRVNAQSLLDDLRSSQGIDTALGLPPGPNSGLSVRRAE